MSNLSHAIRRFNRFELKYLITLRQAEVFKKALKAYLLPDDHGNGAYTLTSLYYDSPDYRFFWEKMDGIKFRRKLRIRRYEDESTLTETTPVFLEIKQRLDRVTQKRRALLPYGDVLRLCNERQVPECDPGNRLVVEEAYSMLWQYNLRPVSVVRYQRNALVGSEYDLGLRVTFDTALSYRTANLRLHEPASDLPMLPPDRVVMEIKVNERLPYWLTELVAAHNLSLMRVSKYCRSIELANDFPSARWLVDAN
jgi:SPX domain protein involved in polyphosphate accumulation